ncbi:Membrane-bound lytic murein transglycosylase C precursor [Trichlorobacter ammonificans]|uniref:Membrane-bound lytic murein transglycosylase C n=2 Tax=Trichlorobacter ammonificans TaxID=2916410 RepID=A0ABN8HGF1_9BACT|nr:Membrane-bound lytic murein transglycosylase C precursor [Trichlorobacter ammonificans]
MVSLHRIPDVVLGSALAVVLLMLCALLFAPGIAAADIYRYEDADGVVHFTDTPTDKKFKIFLKDLRKDRQLRTRFRLAAGGDPREYEHLINASAAKYGVSPALVKAVIRAESGYNPNAVSRAGATGLMQLMPGTARSLNVTNTFDPKQNVDGGVRYLRFLLDTFKGDISLALAAYNAGMSKVARYGGIPPYQETRTYVNRVLAGMQQAN